MQTTISTSIANVDFNIGEMIAYAIISPHYGTHCLFHSDMYYITSLGDVLSNVKTKHYIMKANELISHLHKNKDEKIIAYDITYQQNNFYYRFKDDIVNLKVITNIPTILNDIIYNYERIIKNGSPDIIVSLNRDKLLHLLTYTTDDLNISFNINGKILEVNGLYAFCDSIRKVEKNDKKEKKLQSYIDTTSPKSEVYIPAYGILLEAENEYNMVVMRNAYDVQLSGCKDVYYSSRRNGNYRTAIKYGLISLLYQYDDELAKDYVELIELYCKDEKDLYLCYRYFANTLKNTSIYKHISLFSKFTNKE